MFREASPNVQFPKLEEEILSFWEEERIFQKSVSLREGQPQYVFYDGPPFATGLPHYGHLLAGTIKDIVPRYWTMRGRQVYRRFGWDCHGLPVENEASKDLKKLKNLDLSTKYEIERFGVDQFNEYCRSIVQKYTAEWEYVVKRMGRWVDFKNHYRTMDRDFMESIWWVFKQLWDKGLVYQGYRVMPFSWKLSTPLSNFEANMNYQNVQDVAITVKFSVADQPGTHFLAWTTTPWTLPSNLVLAVGPDITYVKVKEPDGEAFHILAESRLAELERLTKTSYIRCETMPGRDLVGMTYVPLFPYFEDRRKQGAFRVVASNEVTTDEGTGIVHMAPAYGEVDFEVCSREAVPLVDPVDMEGRFTDQVGEFAGYFVKDADAHIIRYLKEKNILLHHGTIQHNYPFCWRSNTPLIYKAISTWFVRVEQLRDRMIANNQQIHWVPESIGSHRFGNWLESARDWNISRNRYWGTPIPVWRCEETGECIALGSVHELEQLTGQTINDLHSHFIDALTIEKDGHIFRRIPEVFDCWFESGSMPYAQNHYPFENKETFERNFPADFIAEGLDQTRGWFYTLTVLSTALFDQPAFKNVVVNGLILAEDGQKMSKQKKNYPDPMEIINQYGADCLRSYLINSPVVRAEPLRFQEKGIVQVFRKVVSPLWNAYSFFVTYANLDGFQPTGDLTSSPHDLDRWIISRFQTLVDDVNRHMSGSYLYHVIPELERFIDLLTNWYIRRSRRRFWRAQNDQDKQHAYNSLYYVLTEFSKVMAPFLPFVCEAIYRNLVASIDDQKPNSVHLCDYPSPNTKLRSTEIEKDMDLIYRTVTLGRSLRSKHDLKIRQPLACLRVVADAEQRQVLDRLGDIVKEELNVKEIEYLRQESDLIEYQARPNLKALGPRFGKKTRALGEAIREMTHQQIADLLDRGTYSLLGEEIRSEDILVDRQQKADQVVAGEQEITLALDTRITPELALEGHARELINRIQNLRKEAGFRVEDHIHLRIECQALEACLETHGAYIQRETLADTLNASSFSPEFEKTWDVNGLPVSFALARNQVDPG